MDMLKVGVVMVCLFRYLQITYIFVRITEIGFLICVPEALHCLFEFGMDEVAASTWG